AYRTLQDGSQSYVLNFTVNVGGVVPGSAATYQSGPRWTELRRNPATGALSVNQQATYAPGSMPLAPAGRRNTFMSSIAQDGEGNSGMGVSLSSSTQIPSIAYVGRAAADPPNQFTGVEQTLFTGTIQTATANRWGDYSSMSVDPADECTFWHANEYIPVG